MLESQGKCQSHMSVTFTNLFQDGVLRQNQSFFSQFSIFTYQYIVLKLYELLYSSGPEGTQAVRPCRRPSHPAGRAWQALGSAEPDPS